MIFNKRFPGKAWRILVATFQSFSNNNGLKLSASLAYYTVFSIAPLLILVIALTSVFFGRDAVNNSLHPQIVHYIGDAAATQVQDVIKHLQLSGKTGFAVVAGVVTLLLGASSVFVEIQDSLNTIWCVRAKPKKGWVKLIVNRFISFSLIISLGFLLMTSLTINILMSALSERLKHFLPELTVLVFNGLNILFTVIVIAVLFGIIFKFLPDVNIKWKDVRSGAVFTSLLFMLGQYLISIYLRYSAQASAYGAAGSVIIILIWIYYTAAILYIGAEFTRVYAEARGSKIEPAEYAVLIRQTEVETVVKQIPAQNPSITGELKKE